MKRYGATLLLLMIPALAALAHDCYLYYNNMEKGFMLSDYGYIWITYAPASYAEFMSGNNDSMHALIQSLLKQKAVLVGVGYALFLFCGMGLTYLILKLLFGGLGGPSYAQGGERNLKNRENSKKLVYKRK